MTFHLLDFLYYDLEKLCDADIVSNHGSQIDYIASAI
jgi:hypothetical protein